MPKMTRERRLLMVELEDYPKDLVSKFFAATRNWSNRDARRLAYIQAVKDYQKELEKYYGDQWPFVVSERYNDVTLAERMFAFPKETFVLKQENRAEKIKEREEQFQANYVKALINTGNYDLAQKVAELKKRDWLNFSFLSPAIEYIYWPVETPEEDIDEYNELTHRDVEDVLNEIKRKYNV